MSIEISIKQKGLFKKKIDLGLIEKLCSEHGFRYGLMDGSLRFEEYKEEKGVKNVNFTIYDPKMIGRGFDVLVKENQFDIDMRLNTPSTNEDIDAHYKALKFLCKSLGVKSYVSDAIDNSVETDVSEIEKERVHVTAWNLEQLLKMIPEYKSLTIFCVMYPVCIESEFAKQLIHMDKIFVMKEFADYLHDKQSNDYYYASPTMYCDKEDNFFGVFAITEDVDSIFQLEPMIPALLFNQIKEVNEWKVNLGAFDGEYYSAGVVSHEHFCKVLELDKKPRFDERCVVVKLTKEDIEKVLSK